MNYGLRKAHKYIWLILVLIIPVIILFSIKDLGVFSPENIGVSQIEDSNRINLGYVENDLISASFSENKIKIILKTTLKNSSSVVYATDAKGNKTRIIGQLTTVGVYTFNSISKPKGIIIYDDLKGILITKIIFK